MERTQKLVNGEYIWINIKTYTEFDENGNRYNPNIVQQTTEEIAKVLRECPICSGIGKTQIWDGTYRLYGNEGSVIVTCSRCLGKGVIECECCEDKEY